jgi:hypothetical protein
MTRFQDPGALPEFLKRCKREDAVSGVIAVIEFEGVALGRVAAETIADPDARMSDGELLVRRSEARLG